MAPHLDHLKVTGFGCIKDVTVALTPLHAFIGPNDSGKSTLLRAVLAWSVPLGGDSSRMSCWPVHGRSSARVDVGLAASRAQVTGGNLSTHSNVDPLFAIGPAMRLLRLDPDAMREPSGLIKDGLPIAFDERGRGLAGVYDAFLSRRLDVFLEISRRFREIFPTAKAIRLTNPTADTKAIGIELVNGATASAPYLSEGMLYWLAFAALPYLDGTRLVLIEEPENGLHPARIAEVMRVLRELSKTTQILIATHSPLVINELQPDEVTLITRTPEAGTIATPMTQTNNFEQRHKVYALGELWLNYADGEQESDLVGESTTKLSAAT